MNTAKVELANALKLVKELRIQVKQERLNDKLVRQHARELKAQQLAAKKAQREEARIARIAKLEAQLEALRLKAQSPKAMKRSAKKPSKPVVVEKVA